MGDAPVEVQRECEVALAALTRAVPSSAGVTGSVAEWAGAIGALQRVIDVASAAQDAAMARLAAIETEVAEDGTLVERCLGLGHAALDAPAVVSGVLKVSAPYAERRLRSALRLAADGPAGSLSHTGLGGLHAAMAAGRVDAYRASVVADELEEAPPQVAASVVAALDGFFGDEDGPRLRRRCRRVLARVSPDFLVQRARRARQECGLRRWAAEPGVDRWEGTFPSEDAARAWAAVDALARRYVADGLCPGIDRARAKALTDLVAGHATVEAVVTLTVPAEVLAAGTPPVGRSAPAGAFTGAPSGGAEDLVEVTGPRGGDPVLVPRGWVGAALAGSRSAVEVAACHPGTGALLDAERPAHRSTPTSTAANRPTDGGFDARTVDGPTVPGTYRPSRRVAARVRARDRRCRFPGCSIAAVFCDVDHVRAWPGGPTALTNLVCLCRRHHRVKQRPGWAVRLAADGTVSWTDPTGRTRTTSPVDALSTSSCPVPPTRPLSRPRRAGPAPSCPTGRTAPGSSSSSTWPRARGRRPRGVTGSGASTVSSTSRSGRACSSPIPTPGRTDREGSAAGAAATATPRRSDAVERDRAG